MKEMEDVTKSATFYALREAGRKLQAVAKVRAPVYKGALNESPYGDAQAKAESGQLRDSIKNARRIKNDGGSYSLSVGPFGKVTRAKGSGARGVQLYRGQVEEMYHYMASGFNGVDLPAEYEKALAEGYRRFKV